MQDSLLPSNSSQQPSKPEFLQMDQEHFNLEHSAHPSIAIATFLFKGLALAVYMFFSLFLSNISTFILTTLISTLDFYITKNISGRILVGLRWWRSVDSVSNQEVFKFESHDPTHTFNKVDSTIFWSSQILAALVWALFLLLNILGLNLYWCLMILVQLSLLSINLYGYYLCRSEYKNKFDHFKNYFQTQGQQKMQSVQGKFIDKAAEMYKQNLLKKANQQNNNVV